MLNWICFSILVLPWIIIPNPKIADPFRVPKEAFFDIICMGIICLGLMRGITFTYRNKYLSWFSMWIFITFIFNYYINRVFIFDNQQLWNVWAVPSMFHFILALFSSFIVMSYLDKDDYLKIAKYLCISATLVSVFGILQVIGFDPYAKLSHYNHPNKFSGLLDNPNVMGNYLCLIYPLFYIFKEKKMILMSLIVALGVFLSHSTLAILVTTLGFLVIIFLKSNSKIIKWGCFTTIILFGILFIGNIKMLKLHSGFDGRLELWGIALNHLKDNPLFGQGLGIFKTFGISIKSTLWAVAHNDWLERTIEIGVLGLFLMLLVVFHSIRNFNYKSKDFLGVCYLVSFTSFLFLMLGSFPMETAPTAFTGLLSWWAVEKL